MAHPVYLVFTYPKNPWDVMGCQTHLSWGPWGVMNGGSGVSIGGGDGCLG